MKLNIPYLCRRVNIIFVLSNSSTTFASIISAYVYNNCHVYYINGLKTMKSPGVTYISINKDLINYINEA